MLGPKAVCARACARAWRCVRACVRVCVCLCASICVCVCVCECEWVCVWVWVCVRVRACLGACACVYARTRVSQFASKRICAASGARASSMTKCLRHSAIKLFFTAQPGGPYVQNPPTPP